MPIPARNVRRIKGTMEASVDAAIAQMTWLKPSDYALVTLALKYAQSIDTGGDDQKAIGYLGQQLHSVMKSLGGTPAERKLLDQEGGARGGLGSLREARAARERNAQAVDPTA